MGLGRSLSGRQRLNQMETGFVSFCWSGWARQIVAKRVAQVDRCKRARRSRRLGAGVKEKKRTPCSAHLFNNSGRNAVLNRVKNCWTPGRIPRTTVQYRIPPNELLWAEGHRHRSPIILPFPCPLFYNFSFRRPTLTQQNCHGFISEYVENWFGFDLC